MKRTHTQTGFTIAELIIVIVVIGILATIVGLGYSGAVTHSRNQNAAASANVLAKKLENYYSATGSYPIDPSAAAYTNTLNGRSDSSIANANVTIGAQGTIGPENGQNTVQVSLCTSPQAVVDATAYRIDYWDYNANNFSTDPIIGNASTIPCDSGAWQPLN